MNIILTTEMIKNVHPKWYLPKVLIGKIVINAIKIKIKQMSIKHSAWGNQVKMHVVHSY